ncbi:MAG TPA: NUDIX domain-containing protein [Miltoncostaeaceae bacterium]|nr:NUDIX domain-containing protein [Miltoncostaeaceae bacterium]
MPRRSAGLLLWRRGPEGIEVLIGHMGGPFWARRDDGAWSIPKGEYPEGDDPLAHALREFAEEMGAPPPDGPDVALGEFRQSGKVVTVFAREGDFDATAIRSNHFTVEWPPRSGRFRSFPEIDRAAWMTLDAARPKLVKGQVPALDALAAAVPAP